MTREQQEALARTRFMMLSAARASGAILMLIGLWIWYGDIVQPGGFPALGGALFVLGFFESLILPQMLARKWRTPPGP